jgi:predicted DNA-binding protein YlxM (UPF0122 family)
MTDQTNKDKEEMLLKAGAEIAPAPEVKYKHPDAELDVADQDKIFQLYCMDRKSVTSISRELKISRELISNLIRSKQLTKLRDDIILSERKELIKSARHKIATGFSDNITVASEIAGFYKRKLLKSKKAHGDISHFISTLSEKDFSIMKYTMDILHRYVHTGLNSELAKGDAETNAATAPVVVEFSEGYKPELLEDSRFKAADIIKSVEARTAAEEKESIELIEVIDTDHVKEMDVEDDSKDKL